MSDDEVCARCMEDFPIAPEVFSVQMGYLFPLSRFAAVVRSRVGEASTDYLCGNCYFDLTDDLV